MANKEPKNEYTIKSLSQNHSHPKGRHMLSIKIANTDT